MIKRRKFIKTASAGAAAVTMLPVLGNISAATGDPAVLGGKKVHKGSWPKWPEWNPDAEDEILEVLQSGNWYRGHGTHVTEFEKKYAKLMGAKRCLATASGTTALLTAMHVLGVDAGDEVIVSPYTFIATYNSVIINKALPVFADTDQETFTMDPASIESRVNERTKALLPVHIYGMPCDMDGINAAAKKHDLVVVEDACQAWLAEYRGKKCGTLGDLGCFSFQNSKHLPAGEGGAIVGNNEEIMDRCYSFHNCGRPFGSVKKTSNYPMRGSNRRMQEFQAVILMSQMKRIKKDADLRLKNALYLSEKLREIPGILPYKLANGATRSAYHLYPFRFKKENFDGLTRDQFVKAVRAEGIPVGSGYGPQYHDGLIEEMLNSRGYKRLFSKERLDRYRDELHNLPNNDQLCEETVCFTQNLLLGNQKDMDDIVDAITKVYENRGKVIKAV